MRLLNTNGRLPGGWRYVQLDANGKVLKEWSKDFDPWQMFLGKVQRFRQLNHLIRQDIHFVESDVQEYLAREFGGDPRYFAMDEAQKKTSYLSRFQSRAAKLAARGKNLIDGAGILADWLGEGLKPVATGVAQARADVCIRQPDGKPCPHNNPGFKPVETIAQIIRAWSEKKNEMTISVEGETKLHTCSLCFCDLKTKVHVPMETIIDRTPSAMLDKFASDAPKNCWMRSQK